MILEINLKIMKIAIMFIFTYFTNYKIVNRKDDKLLRHKVLNFIIVVLVSIICGIIRYKIDFLASIICLILMVSIIFNKDNIKEALLVTIISLTINYIVNLLASAIYYVPSRLFQLEDKYLNLVIITVLRLILLKFILRRKKLKYGISFLNRSGQNTYMDLIVLNISAIILFVVILYENANELKLDVMGINVILLSMISIISLQKSIQLYYKQKLFIQDLNETKDELRRKNEEIAKLEAENLNFSKKSHSLAHKQKALEFKLNQLMLKYETAEEIEIKDRLESISKELYENTSSVELTKTDIPEIDDMLNFMQSECEKNKIDFNLQISGNIYHMINNIISKEELEILLADHIKDAIIAIKHTDNVNKSILVKLGKIEECYGLYIYDSGIEFEKETLENLGKKPSTTHADEGGTGMGFMNTFDTLRKHNASLIINEIGKPTKENYTKVIMIKFDNKNEFKVISYRN